MANFTNIPFLNPIKFVPATATPGLHFDDDWAYNQIKLWERKVCWKQKWKTGHTTKLHVISTVTPASLKVYNARRVVNSIPWTLVLSSGTSAGDIYELNLQLDTDASSIALPVGTYWLYLEAIQGSYQAKFISEPIDVQASHNNLSAIEYTNTLNDFGVYFAVTKIKFKLLAEAQLSEFIPESETTDYIDQIHNAEILSGTPYRNWKLLIGNTPGVTDYLADLLNRILLCDSVRFNGKLITKVSGAKWEPRREKGYPLAGWSLDVTEKINLSGLQHNDENPVIPGVVIAYDISDDLFGETDGNNIHILDIEQT